MSPTLRIHKPLKDRLNPHQRTKRRMRMAKTGTWRQNMEREHAKTRGNTHMALQGVEVTFRKARVTRWMAYGLAVTQLVTLARVFGLI